MSGGGTEAGVAEAGVPGSVIRSWDKTDDVRLREALERGDGKKTWSQIARDAFPDGAFGKAECQAVSLEQLAFSSACSFNRQCATSTSPTSRARRSGAAE